MKTCPRCGKTKPLSEFYVRKNGYPSSLCKRDSIAYAIERRAANPESFRAAARRYTKAHPEAIRAGQRRWADRNHGAQQAQRRASYAITKALAAGTLTRPAVCERCGAAAYIEAAHFNYVELLRVRWLCRPCHRTWDRMRSKAAHPEPIEDVA